MKKLFLPLLLVFLVGCAGTNNPNGKPYEDVVSPGKVELLNLTGEKSTAGAAEVYFSTSQRTEAMVVFKDRLIAIQVDGKDLPGADRGDKFTYPTGYQAIALKPGIHSISYCYATRSTLGTGIWGCNLKISNFNFEPDARYMVQGQTTVSTGSIGNTMTQAARVTSGIYKLD
jgi:hypothetical protein